MYKVTIEIKVGDAWDDKQAAGALCFCEIPVRFNKLWTAADLLSGAANAIKAERKSLE